MEGLDISFLVRENIISGDEYIHILSMEPKDAIKLVNLIIEQEFPTKKNEKKRNR